MHCKSLAAQEVLTARKLVQSKLRDVENNFGPRIRELVAGQANLEMANAAPFSVHALLLGQSQAFEKRFARWFAGTPGPGA